MDEKDTGNRGAPAPITGLLAEHTEPMMNMKLLAGAGIVGLLATCWGKVKAVFASLRSIVFVQAQIEDSMIPALSAWCWAHCRRSRWGDRRYGGVWMHVRGKGEQPRLIPVEELSGHSAVFWRGWRPLWVSQSRGGTPDTPTAAGHQTGPHVTAGFIRGTYDLDSLLVEMAELYTRRRRGGNRRRRYAIFRLFGKGPPEARAQAQQPHEGEQSAARDNQQSPVLGEWRPLGVRLEDLAWEAAGDEEADPMASLAYPPPIWELLDEAKRWLASRTWFRERSIPWRRGWLLHGVPGTGKTSLVRALAWRLDLPIFCFDLSGMSNQELVGHWRRASSAAPCVALMEDLDSVFDRRRNLLGRNGGGLTFDCLLNCVSGIQGSQGVFLVVTTNGAAALDAAMLRAGRLDRLIELGPLDRSCRERVAQRILADCPWRIDECVDAGDKETGAAFTERCARIALREFWGSKRELARRAQA